MGFSGRLALAVAAVLGLIAAPSASAKGAPRPAATAPRPAQAVDLVRYDAKAEAVIVPYRGLVPNLRTGIMRRPIAFTAIIGAPARWQGLHRIQPRRHPVLTTVESVPVGRQMKLVMRFKRGTDVYIHHDRKQRAIVFTPIYPGKRRPVEKGPAFAPPIVDHFPDRRPIPHLSPSPTPKPQPVPVPTPMEVPTPVATPTPVPAPTVDPYQGAVELIYGSANVTEINPSGDLLTQIDGGRQLGARYQVRFLPPSPWAERLTPEGWSPFWRTDLTAYSMATVMTDVYLPFSHRFREDSRVEFSLMRELGRGKIWTDAGLGYFARIEESYNTGSPPDLSQAFSFNRLFHGPMLRFSASIPPEEVMIGGVRGWRLFADVDAAPRLITDLDKGVPGLPPLGWSRVQFGIERDMGPFKYRLTAGEWRMTGTGFAETSQVSSFTLNWSTHLP